MKLSETQLAEVAKWFAAGERLAEIQRRIADRFGLEMTYLDVRLLVADLPPPHEPEPTAPAAPVSTESPDPAAPIPEDAPAEPVETKALPPEGQGVGVSVALSPIEIPGTIASGTVTFSDGVSGKWYLDQQGRLAFGELPNGYRPAPDDADDFRRELISLLQSKGLA